MITLKQQQSTLYITITGQLLISSIYELTSALTRFADTCNKYYLDLQDVDLVSDGGLAVLVMFTSHAKRHGQSVLLMDCSSAVTQRIAQIPSLLALCQYPYDSNPLYQELDQSELQCTKSTLYGSKDDVRSPNIFI